MANLRKWMGACVLLLLSGSSLAGQPKQSEDARQKAASLERIAPEARTDRQRVELAQSYYKLGRLEDASNQAAKVLEDDVDNAEAWVIQGDVWRERGRWQQALGAYNRAARLAPDTATIELRRGQALMELGKTKEADAAFARYRAFSQAESVNHKTK